MGFCGSVDNDDNDDGHSHDDVDDDNIDDDFCVTLLLLYYRCTCCHKSRIKNPKRLNSDRIQTLQLEPVEKELANLIGQKQFELLHCSLLVGELVFIERFDGDLSPVLFCLFRIYFP